MQLAAPSLLFSLAVFATALHAQTASPEPPELRAARARYEQEAAAATAPAKARYALALDAIKKTLGGRGDLAGALVVQHEIEGLRPAPNPLPLTQKQAKVVVWNQHNGNHNNAGARILNVALLADGKEVWRQNDIKIPWEQNVDTKVEVSVPYVPTDKLRVEVAEVVDHGGGLAEIEYWWEGRNLALKRPVAVSAVWGNDSRCGGATLTDGITSSKNEGGYWSLPDRALGWAEVSLTGASLTSDASAGGEKNRTGEAAQPSASAPPAGYFGKKPL